MTDRRCAACAYAQRGVLNGQNEDGDADRPTRLRFKPEKPPLRCHRWPKQVYPTVLGFTGISGGMPTSWFPEVAPADWCGEFRTSLD